LRTHGRSQAPMIALSASRQMLEEAKNSQLFEATMSKPFDVSALLDCVAHYMNNRAAPAT
ncbi:MAG TPA: hypothetical protein VF221_08880, partial [Chloroflexota bacterium]